MADRCGRLEESTDSVVNLSAVFRTRIPDAATTGSTIAAASTPPSPAISSRRPTEFVLLTMKFQSCTRHIVRGRGRYYWLHVRSEAGTLAVSSLGVAV